MARGWPDGWGICCECDEGFNPHMYNFCPSCNHSLCRNCDEGGNAWSKYPNSKNPYSIEMLAANAKDLPQQVQDFNNKTLEPATIYDKAKAELQLPGETGASVPHISSFSEIIALNPASNSNDTLPPSNLNGSHNNNGHDIPPNSLNPSTPPVDCPFPAEVISIKQENKRKVLSVLVGSTSQLACADSGSDKNIMSKTFATQHKLRIKHRARDIKEFQLGSGESIWSIGRVLASIKLVGSTLRRQMRRFYIFRACPVPLILGMPFLEEAEILTKNRHLLQHCPTKFRSIPSLLWIGSPQAHLSPRNQIQCYLDGRRLVAIADTGSDLNFMSCKCTQREGFRVDSRENAKTWVQFGDGTQAKTVGQVYIYNLILDWRKPVTKVLSKPNSTADISSSTDLSPEAKEPFYTVFHVLQKLSHDVILGRTLLDETDAFNRYSNSFTSSVRNDARSQLNIFIKIPNWAKKRTKPAPDPKESHDNYCRRERHRRAKRANEIALLPSDVKDSAKNEESVQIGEWDAEHATCSYCNPV